MNLSFRHYYWRWLKNLCFLFLLFVILMTLARATFTFYFGDLNTLKNSLDEVRKAFFLGLRFDLVPLAYINALPFILLHLAYFLPGKLTIKGTRLLVIGSLSVGYFLLTWLFVSDYAFYSYYQDHLNVLFFGLFEDDTQAVLISIWKNYNLPLWLFVILLLHYSFYRLVKFMFSLFEFDLKVRKTPLKVLGCFILGLACLGFMGRGNFTRLPLSVEDAHISQNQFINEIAINGVLTLNRAIKIRKTFGKDQYDYQRSFGFSSWQSAFEAAMRKKPSKSNLVSSLIRRTPLSEKLRASPPHVVMVVMESFGSYWNEHDSETFQIFGELKNHFDSGIFFKNFLPAENGTIGSFVSVATSQVIRPGARFLSESEYMATPLSSAGHLPFKEKGYETHFVYGGKLGWRDLGKYLSVQGYDHRWGADEMREAMPELNNFSARDLGNEWGIFDEYLFSFIDEQLRTATKPQFFIVLTTSNHPPFEYPSSYRPLPLEFTPEILSKITVSVDLATKRFLGFQYANQKIGEFITRIKASSLKDNVIVGLTGDHSFWIAKGVGMEEEFKRYAVPFFLSVPKKLKPAVIDTNKFGSHEDIFPTLYHLSLSDQQYVGLGENLFSGKSHAINSSGIVANELGAFHHESFWEWEDLAKQRLKLAKENASLKELSEHRNGLISVTDNYLKEEKKSKRPAVNNDQQ